MEKEIKRMEKYASKYHIPIIQNEGMEFLQEYIKKHSVKNILEIGSAIGYSAIQMCRMGENIKILTIERDQERYQEAIKNIDSVNMNDKIEILLADALEVEIHGKFDLIFIDAAKAQYTKFFNKYKHFLDDDGVIISDNLKFHGMVENPSLIKGRSTKQLVRKIQSYIDFLKNNEEYESKFYNIGDGIAVSKKRQRID